MTKSEYNKELAELRARLEKLENVEIEEEIPQPPHPRWKPNLNDSYWTVSFGRSSALRFNCDPDLGNYDVGNMFKTQAEAEYAVERLQVLAEMKEWAGGGNDPYILSYNHLSGDLGTHYSGRVVITYGEMRFATKEDAENCIKSVGKERLKKYYFMVSEDEADDDRRA